MCSLAGVVVVVVVSVSMARMGTRRWEKSGKAGHWRVVRGVVDDVSEWQSAL